MSDPTEHSSEERFRAGRTEDEVEGHHYRMGRSGMPDSPEDNESTPGLEDSNADVDAHHFRFSSPVEEAQDVQAHRPGDGDEHDDDNEAEGSARLTDADDDVEGHTRR